MQVIKFDYDKTHKKAVVKCVPHLLGLIRDNFSQEDNGKKMMSRMYHRNIDPTSYAITPSGMFDIWLVFDIIKYLNYKKIEHIIEMTDRFKEAFKSSFNFSYNKGEKIFELKLPLRDYQKEGVEIALSNGNGIFLYPTSAGKTLLMASITHNILKRDSKQKILIVTMTHLVNQLVNDFIEYGVRPSDISAWTGDSEFLNTKIVVAGSTILSNALTYSDSDVKKIKQIIKVCDKGINNKNTTLEDKKELQKKKRDAEKTLQKNEEKTKFNKKIINYLNDIDVVLIDEVHQCKKGNIITKLFSKISTKHTFGFTGTMPNDKIDEWTVLGKVGPIRQIVNRDKLVEEGNITKVDVKFIDILYKDTPSYISTDYSDENWTSSLENFRIESEFLYNSEYRNKVITQIASSIDKNILILVDRIEHGERLKNLIVAKNQNKQVVFICGDVDKEERDKVKNIMETNNNVVCIAITKIFSTGVSIKNIHYILFAVAWKTRVSIIQAIGRGVRTLKGKTKVVLFDIHDMLRYGEKHFQQRLKIYKDEGFRITNTKLTEK